MAAFKPIQWGAGPAATCVVIGLLIALSSAPATSAQPAGSAVPTAVARIAPTNAGDITVTLTFLPSSKHATDQAAWAVPGPPQLDVAERMQCLVNGILMEAVLPPAPQLQAGAPVELLYAVGQNDQPFNLDTLCLRCWVVNGSVTRPVVIQQRLVPTTGVEHRPSSGQPPCVPDIFSCQCAPEAPQPAASSRPAASAAAHSRRRLQQYIMPASPPMNTSSNASDFSCMGPFDTSSGGLMYQSSSLSLGTTDMTPLRSPSGSMTALWFNGSISSQSGPGRWVSVSAQVPGTRSSRSTGIPNRETLLNSSLGTAAVAEFQTSTTMCGDSWPTTDTSVAWLVAAAPLTTLPASVATSCYNVTWQQPGTNATAGNRVAAGTSITGLPLYVCRAAVPQVKLALVPGVTADAWSYCAVYAAKQVFQMDQYEVLYTTGGVSWVSVKNASTPLFLGSMTLDGASPLAGCMVKQQLDNTTSGAAWFMGSLDASRVCSATNGASGVVTAASDTTLVLAASAGAGPCQPTSTAAAGSLNATGGMVLGLRSWRPLGLDRDYDMNPTCMYTYGALDSDSKQCSNVKRVPPVDGMSPLAAFQSTPRPSAGVVLSASDVVITATALTGWPVLTSSMGILYINQGSGAFLLAADLQLPSAPAAVEDVASMLQQWRGLSITARVQPNASLPLAAVELVLLQASSWDAPSGSASWAASVQPRFSAVTLPGGYVVDVHGKAMGLLSPAAGGWQLRVQVGGQLFNGFTTASWAWQRQWCAGPLPGQDWSTASLQVQTPGQQPSGWQFTGRVSSMALPTAGMTFPSTCGFTGDRWAYPLRLQFAVQSKDVVYTLQDLLALQSNGSLPEVSLTFTVTYPDSMSLPAVISVTVVSGQISPSGGFLLVGSAQLQRPCVSEQLQAQALVQGQLNLSKLASLEGSITFTSFASRPEDGVASSIGSYCSKGPQPASAAPRLNGTAGPASSITDDVSFSGNLTAQVPTFTSADSSSISLAGTMVSCIASSANTFVGCRLDLFAPWNSSFPRNLTEVTLTAGLGNNTTQLQLQVADIGGPARLAEQVASISPGAVPARLCSAFLSGSVAFKSSSTLMPIANGTACFTLFLEDSSKRRLPFYTSAPGGPLMPPMGMASAGGVAVRWGLTLDLAASGNGIVPLDVLAARATSCKPAAADAVPAGSIQQGTLQGRPLSGQLQFTSSAVPQPQQSFNSCANQANSPSSGFHTASLTAAVSGTASAAAGALLASFKVSAAHPGSSSVTYQFMLLQGDSRSNGSTTAGLLAVNTTAVCTDQPPRISYGSYVLTQAGSSVTVSLLWGVSPSPGCCTDPTAVNSPAEVTALFRNGGSTCLPRDVLAACGVTCTSELAKMLRKQVASGPGASPTTAGVTVYSSTILGCSDTTCGAATVSSSAQMRQWLVQPDIGLLVASFAIDLSNPQLSWQGSGGSYYYNSNSNQWPPLAPCNSSSCPGFTPLANASWQQQLVSNTSGSEVTINITVAVPGVTPPPIAQFLVGCSRWAYYGLPMSVGALSNNSYSAPSRLCYLNTAQLRDPVSGATSWLSGQQVLLYLADTQLVVNIWAQAYNYQQWLGPPMQPGNGNSSWPGAWQSPAPSPAPFTNSPGTISPGQSPGAGNVKPGSPIPSSPFPVASTGSWPATPPTSSRSWSLPAAFCQKERGQLNWAYLSSTALSSGSLYNAAVSQVGAPADAVNAPAPGTTATYVTASVTDGSLQEVGDVLNGDKQLAGSLVVQLQQAAGAAVGIDPVMMWLGRVDSKDVNTTTSSLVPLGNTMWWASGGSNDKTSNSSSSPVLVGQVSGVLRVNSSGVQQQVYLTGAIMALPPADGAAPSQLSFQGQYLVPLEGAPSACSGNWSQVTYVRGFLQLGKGPTANSSTVRLLLVAQYANRVDPASYQPFTPMVTMFPPGQPVGPRSILDLSLSAGLQSQSEPGPAPSTSAGVTALQGSILEFVYDPWLSLGLARYRATFQGPLPQPLLDALQGRVALQGYMARVVLRQAAAPNKAAAGPIPVADLSGSLQTRRLASTATTISTKAAAAADAVKMVHGLAAQLSGIVYQGPGAGGWFVNCNLKVEPILTNGTITGVQDDSVICTGWPGSQFVDLSSTPRGNMSATAKMGDATYTATGVLTAPWESSKPGFFGTAPSQSLSLVVQNLTVAGDAALYGLVFDPLLPRLPLVYGAINGTLPASKTSLQSLYAINPTRPAGGGSGAWANLLGWLQSGDSTTTTVQLGMGGISVQPTGNVSGLNMSLSGYLSMSSSAVAEFPTGSCSACSSCVAIAAEAMQPVMQVTSAAEVAAHFSDACMDLLQDEAQCGEVAAAIEASKGGNLGKRPGMLCYLLNQCVELQGPSQDSWGSRPGEPTPGLATDPYPGGVADSNGGAAGGVPGKESVIPGLAGGTGQASGVGSGVEQPYRPAGNATTPKPLDTLPVSDWASKTNQTAPSMLPGSPLPVPGVVNKMPVQNSSTTLQPMMPPQNISAINSTAGIASYAPAKPPPTRRLLQMLAATSSTNIPAPVNMSVTSYDSSMSYQGAPGNGSAMYEPGPTIGGIPMMVQLVQSAYYSLGWRGPPPLVVSDDSNCPPSLVPNAAIRGSTPVDLCTADGSLLGPQLPGVLSPFGDLQLPEGRCLMDTQCQQGENCLPFAAAKGTQPDLAPLVPADQTVCYCQNGHDTCVSGYGLCMASNNCLECQNCLQQVLDLYLWANADKPRTTQADAFLQGCMKQTAVAGGSAEFVSMCQNTAAAIANATSLGSLGNRAGMLCQMFGSCQSMPNNCTMTVVAPNGTVQSGAFTTCTVSGVSTGGAKVSSAAVKVPPGGCATDSDCKTGQCFMAPGSSSCSCSEDGKEVCVPMGRCSDNPVTSVCSACQECLTGVYQQVAAPSMVLPASQQAAVLNATCTAAAAAGNQLVNTSKCSALTMMAAVQPDLTQRSAALCLQLGACSTDLGHCSYSIQTVAGPTISGPLDTCTVEGVAGGTPVPGLLPALGCNSTQDSDYGKPGSAVATLPNTASAGVCCRACGSSSACAYWSWRKADGLCSLFADQGSSSYRPAVGMIAGPGTATATSAADVLKGDCLWSADCQAANMVCSLANEIQRCSCVGGMRSCSSVGTCRLTPCGACQSCLKFAAAFAASNVSTTGKLARQQWLLACAAQYPDAKDQCRTTADQLLSMPAWARRPGMLCTLMQICGEASAKDCAAAVKQPEADAAGSSSAGSSSMGSSSVSSLAVDLCSMDGTPAGPQLPGVVAATPGLPSPVGGVNGVCRNSTDCAGFGQACLPANTSTQVCTCSNGIDTCFTPGTCQASACSRCSSCLQFANSLIAQPAAQVPNGDMLGALNQACKSAGGNVSGCMQAINTTASSSPSIFRRAGALCRLMQLCPAGKLPADCTLLVRAPSGTLMSSTGAAVDQCTVEGLAGGAQLPGVARSNQLTPGTCRADADCASAGQRCDSSNSTQLCSCSSETSNITCSTVGQCTMGPCATCSRCLQEVLVSFVLPYQYASATALPGLFNTTCSSRADASNPAACSSVAAAIALSRNSTLGRRAGGLCLALGFCPTELVDSKQCSASVMTPTALKPYNGIVDLCTMEGVSGGTMPPGSAASAALPVGTCNKATPCPGGSICDMSSSQSLCTCQNGKDTCQDVGQCKPSPCSACASCLSNATAWVTSTTLRMNSSLQAAAAISALCRGSGRNASSCLKLQAAVAGSAAGNLGKRAGAMCVALQECSTDLEGCSWGGAVNDSSTSLDLCSVNGLSSGAAVPGTAPAGSASAAVPPGLCSSAEDCDADMLCSKGDIVQQCSCNGGNDTCVSLGRCVPGPCRTCSSCLQEMRSFAAQQLGTNDAAAVSKAFGTYCSRPGTQRSMLACQAAQAAVAASITGNLGKRPASLCRQLKECVLDVDSACALPGPTANTTVPSTSLDACSTDGVTSAKRVPGVSASADVPAGACIGAAGCSDGQTCSFAGPTQLCTCKDGSDTCVPLGTCVTTDCGRCQACINQVVSFTVGQQTAPDSNLSTAWTGFCTGPLARPKDTCASVAAAIAASPRTGRRAGLLCGLLQDCATAAGKDACSIKVVLPSGGSKQGPLDLCTVEGMQGGTAAAGTSAAFTVSGTQCFTAADCKGAAGVCDISSSNSTSCVCDGGRDSCRIVGTCTKSPCRLCNDCLNEWALFAARQQFQTKAPAVAAAFSQACINSGRSAAACKALSSNISSSAAGNLGKRAAAMCMALNDCPDDASTLEPSCQLTVPRADKGANLSAAAALDLCTLEGIANGTTLPGVSPGGQLPQDTCDADADCGLGMVCSRADVRPLCTCTGGMDACRTIGGCVQDPCRTCNRCIAAWQGFAASQANASSPSQVADALRAQCLVTNNSPAACQAAAASIASSLNGNAGKRAGMICQQLGMCAATGSCVVSLANGSLVGQLDLCTQQGVAFGSPVPGIASSSSLPAGRCRVDGDCGARSLCSREPLLVSSLCTCTGGRDSCEKLGQCRQDACSRCQTCISGLQPYIASLGVPGAPSTAEGIASLFAATCVAPPISEVPTKCQAASNAIRNSLNGNLGRRAGALCSMLEACKPGLAAGDCVLSAGAVNGSFDACTAQGVAAGTLLPGMSTGVPAGACDNDAACSAGQQCSRANTTTVCRCSGGIDACRDMGVCTAVPPPVPPCERCSKCLASVAATLQPWLAVASPTASSMGDAAASWCASQPAYSSNACDNLASAVRNSAGGTLALRAGAVCDRLGQCRSCSGTVTAGAATGLLDLCTVEGVASGTQLPGTFTGAGVGPAGTCQRSSDCSNGFICKQQPTVLVTRCLMGGDVVSRVGTCQAPPPPPPPPPALPTPCQACQQCLLAVQPFIGRLSSTADGPAVAQAAFRQCQALGTLTDVQCRDLRNDVSKSYQGNAGRRAAWVCSRMGACSQDGLGANCTLSVPSTVNSSLAVTGALDLCSVEGVAGGAAVAGITLQTNLSGGMCVTSKDCPAAASACSMATTSTQCTCSGGQDTCTLLGQCMDYCSTPEAQAFLASVASSITPCNPFLPNQCGGGLLCQPSTQCRSASCDPVKGLQLVACNAVCAPAQRLMTSAQLKDDASGAVVQLNAPARSMVAPCDAFFSTAAAQQLGSGAQCSTQDRTLAIQFGAGATVPVGAVWTLQPAQQQLVDLVSSTAAFSGNVTLDTCLACQRPNALLVGPSVVSEPCDVSSASPVTFDASYSTDPSGRPLVSYVWSQQQADPALQAAIDAANAAAGGRGASRLVLQPSMLPNLADGSYTLGLYVTSWLGLSGSSSLSFTKVTAGTAPMVALVGDTTQSFLVSDGVRVVSQLVASSVCPGSQMQYSWTSLDGWAAIPAGYSNKDLVLPPPVAAVVGQSYRVQLSFGFVGSSTTNSIPVTLVAQGPPLVATLDGPSGDVPETWTLVLNGSRSQDPADPAALLSYSWSCMRADFPTPCFNSSQQGLQAGPLWTIPGGLLEPGVAHTFVVTAGKDTRTASAQLTLTPRQGAVPTAQLQRQCAASAADSTGACVALHNTDEPLSVLLQLPPGAGDISWGWQVGGQDVAASSGLTKLTIPVEQLPPRGAVAVSVQLTNTTSNATGSTSIIVQLNPRPQCTGVGDNSCLVITTLSDKFAQDRFQASAVGWADDSGNLTYTFTAGGYTTSGPTTTIQLSGLPVGNTTVSVCAVDGDSAQTCQQQQVTVVPPPPDFQVDVALSQLDVGQLQGSGDPEVLGAGAQALVSLAGYAASNSTNTSSAADQVLQDKAAELVGALSETAAGLLNDPAALTQVASSVADLTTITSDPSPDTQDQLTAITDQVIASLNLAGQGADNNTVSDLLQVLGTVADSSTSGSNSSTAPASTRRRLLASSSCAGPSTLVASLQATAALLAQARSSLAHAGNAGLFVTTLSTDGRSLANGTLPVGPGAASGAHPSTNVGVRFHRPLLGSCRTPSANGSMVTSPCPDAVLSVRLLMAQDARALLCSNSSRGGPAAGRRRLTASSLSEADVTPLSAAVTVSVADFTVLPCADPSNCSLTLTFPLNSPVALGDTGVRCLRVQNGSLLLPNSSDPWQLGAVQPAAGSQSAGTADCTASEAGTFTIARLNSVPLPAGSPSPAASPSPVPSPSPLSSPSPSPNASLGMQENPPAATPSPAPVPLPARVSLVNLAVTFPLNYSSLVANPAAEKSFKEGVASSVAAAAEVPVSWVEVLGLREGSVVADVAVRLPADNYTSSQLAAVGVAVTTDPDSVFKNLKATFGITEPITAKVTAIEPANSASGPSYSKVGLGVGLGVGLAVVLALVAMAVLSRRSSEPQRSRTYAPQPQAAPAAAYPVPDVRETAQLGLDSE